MLKNFNNILLATDIDGTLLYSDRETKKHVIPPYNIEQIRHMTENGGLFTIATGRTMVTARSVVESVPVNAPVILMNGAELYDFSKEKIIWSKPIDVRIFDYVDELLRRFQQLAVVFYTHDEFYVVNYHSKVHIFFDIIDRYHFLASADMAPREFYQLAVSGDPEDITAAYELLGEFVRDGKLDAAYSCTGPRLMVVDAPDVSKGGAIQKLAELCSVPHENVLAIGDYENDIEMLQSAGRSACPSSGLERAKQAADYIALPAEEGAVGDFIRAVEEEEVPARV